MIPAVAATDRENPTEATNPGAARIDTPTAPPSAVHGDTDELSLRRLAEEGRASTTTLRKLVAYWETVT